MSPTAKADTCESSLPLLRGLHYSDADYELAREHGRLLLLDVDLGPTCNLACVYCDRSEDITHAAQARTLTLQDTVEVIEAGHTLGAATIQFPGAGEPLLDDNLWTLGIAVGFGLAALMGCDPTKSTGPSEVVLTFILGQSPSLFFATAPWLPDNYYPVFTFTPPNPLARLALSVVLSCGYAIAFSLSFKVFLNVFL